MLKLNRGFTLVELLIVIVVIGILAAITLVTYNGVQTKANNAAIASAASDSLKLLTAYTTTNGSYPLMTNTGCLTPPAGSTTCTWGGSSLAVSSILTNNLSTIGSLPTSVPSNADSTYNGIIYTAYPTRTVDGVVAPALLVYTLIGKTTCPVGHVLNNGSYTTQTSTTGYSSYTSSGNTLCVTSVPGP